MRAAVEVMNRKGVRGMTLADVASQLKLVPTAVNYYFRRKEDLAVACILEAIAHFNALLDGCQDERTPQARLHRFLHDFVAHLAAVSAGEAAPVATFNDVRTIDDPEAGAAYVEMFRRFRRTFVAAAGGADDPQIRRARNARTHMLISQVFWAAFWLRNYEAADYRRMIDRLHAVLVHGLAAPSADWAPADLPPPEEERGEGASPTAFLRAATDMVNEHGYLGASVSRISARLNVTKGSFYHHNQAKDDLVAQCFERTLAIMRQAQIDAEAARMTGLNTVATLATSMVAHQVSGECPLLRTSALTAVPEDLQHCVAQRFNRYAARLASAISDGVADGSVRPVDSNVAAQMITGLINASSELHHWAPGLRPAEAAGIYVRPLFLGLFHSLR